MRFQSSTIAFIVALTAAVLLQGAPADAQTAQPGVRDRAERLKPIIEWVETEQKNASILGDVAEALGIGTGEEVATLAKIHRDPAGLQYSFHIVKDHPDVLIMIRSNYEIADSWRLLKTGLIERSVHVDEQDKVHLFRFQPRLFEETLRFFEASVQALRQQTPAAPNAASAAETPPGPAPSTVSNSAPWARPPTAATAPADNFAALIARGTEYNLNNDYSRAMADFNEAIKLNPNSTAAFYGRAAVYYNLADFDRAIQDYDRVLRLDPGNDLAATFRALTYEKKNQR